MKNRPDFTRIRNDFPMLQKTMHGKPLIYFDTAATAQKPQSVIDAIVDYYQNHCGTVHRTIYDLSSFPTTEYNHTRKKVQQLLNAKYEEEIIFTRGTTESINMVAYSFGKAFIQPDDEVIISAMEHHANIVPWQIMCEDRKAKLKVIPINEEGELMIDAFQKMLTPRTKMVAIAHISNTLGTLNPIKEIVAIAHRNGAKVLVDGAQAVPHMVVDVQELDADFYAFSGHKFYGPTGIGILYGKKELLDLMPPVQGGGMMIDNVTFDKTTYNTLPLKFEAGTPPIAQALGLGKAIDYIQDIGLDNIAQYEQELLSYATEKFQSIKGLRILGTAKEKGAIISFIVEGIHPLDLATLLDLKGIAIRSGHNCAQPLIQQFGVTSIARASFAFYNTKKEIDTFCNALQESTSSLVS